MEKGKVVTYVTEKGFGFIKVTGQKENVYFHVNKGKIVENGTSETRVPKIGDKLVFISAKRNKGLYASSWGFEVEAPKREEVFVSQCPSIPVVEETTDEDTADVNGNIAKKQYRKPNRFAGKNTSWKGEHSHEPRPTGKGDKKDWRKETSL